MIKAEVNYGQQDPTDDELNRLSVEQLQDLRDLMDKLGTEGVMKYTRVLEQVGVIEGEYRDVRAGARLGIN